MNIMGLTTGQSIASLARAKVRDTAPEAPLGAPAPAGAAIGKASDATLFGGATANGFTMNLIGPSGGLVDPKITALLNSQLGQLDAVDTEAGTQEAPPEGAPAGMRFATPNFFHMDLGGGQALEIRHGPEGQGEYNPAAMRAMMATIEALTRALSRS